MSEYYNTTGAKGTQLNLYESKAITQNERILNFFKASTKICFTPSQVWRAEFNDRTPLTSVRRSISNLTEKGLLRQTEEQREGIYGRNEKTWILC